MFVDAADTLIARTSFSATGLETVWCEAFAIEGPAIVDAVVVSNELPNLPHLDLDMIGHFALAKIKGAILAVTGR
jgi:hypothetical protein